jgi:hypothetical protein
MSISPNFRKTVNGRKAGDRFRIENAVTDDSKPAGVPLRQQNVSVPHERHPPRVLEILDDDDRPKFRICGGARLRRRGRRPAFWKDFCEVVFHHRHLIWRYRSTVADHLIDDAVPLKPQMA